MLVEEYVLIHKGSFGASGSDKIRRRVFLIKGVNLDIVQRQITAKAVGIGKVSVQSLNQKANSPIHR